MKWWNCNIVKASLVVLFALSLFAGCSNRGIDRVEWMTMGTIAAVQWRGKCDADVRKAIEAAVAAEFDKVVGEFNAFDPNSAINRLGRCTDFGRPCWDFAYVLKRDTAGAFDPGWKHDGSLDFGAVAKGFAVDLAADAVRGNLPDGMDMLIDLGGNLKAVKGDWKVGVKDGDDFVLKEGESCATSATYFRGNHIHNATNGKAINGDVHSVTIVHPTSAMVADGLSTVMFILGKDAGTGFLKRFHPEVKVVWVNAGL